MWSICGFGVTFVSFKLLLHLWGHNKWLACEPVVICVISATKYNRVKPAKEMTRILKVKQEVAGSEPISVCISGPGLVWKKHHGRKMGLKQTPHEGHHPSPWTGKSLKLAMSPRFDKKKNLVSHAVWMCLHCMTTGGISIIWLKCARVQHIITFPFTPLLYSFIPICAFMPRHLECVSL